MEDSLPTHLNAHPKIKHIVFSQNWKQAGSNYHKLLRSKQYDIIQGHNLTMLSPIIFHHSKDYPALRVWFAHNLYLYDEKSKEWKPLLKLSNGEFVLQLVEAKKRRLYLLSERALYLFDQGKLTVIHMRSGNELLRSFVWDAQTQDFYLASNRKLYRSLFPYNTWTHLMTAPRQLTQLAFFIVKVQIGTICKIQSPLLTPPSKQRRMFT
jgi:hypothetical protein